jgi:hypothetical protein
MSLNCIHVHEIVTHITTRRLQGHIQTNVLYLSPKSLKETFANRTDNIIPDISDFCVLVCINYVVSSIRKPN